MISQMEALLDIAKMKAEPLHPDLKRWVEDGEFGPMLRHPLVYMVPLLLPGEANKAFEQKKGLLAQAELDHNWEKIIWLHERAYRLNALIDYCTGRDDQGEVIPLVDCPDHWNLAGDVWVDSENIEQMNNVWRELIPEWSMNHLWIGHPEEREAFDKLPDIIRAWRGGAVGDWSWTTSKAVAERFSRMSGFNPRSAMIPKSDCFGYLTRRSEYELLVRLTPERQHLVYPQEKM